VAAEFNIERAKRVIEHDKNMRFEELRALEQRIDFIEEAYARLPLQQRTPSMKQAWICCCLREIARTFTKPEVRDEWTRRPRFTTELLDAFGQLAKNHRPAMCALPRERRDGKAVVSQQDRFRKATEARAAAILESAVSDGLGNEQKWARKIADRLFEAGMATNRNAPYTRDAVIKWRNKFRSDKKRRFHATTIYAKGRERLLAMKNTVREPELHLRALEQELTNLTAEIQPFMGAPSRRAHGEALEPAVAAFCFQVFGSVPTRESLETLY
jgi:hypothetical protein